MFKAEEQQDEDDQNHDTKYDLAREIVNELEDQVGVPADTYLFDSWFAHGSGLPGLIESYDKDWIGPLRSNRQVTYGGEEIRVDALGASTRLNAKSKTRPTTSRQRSFVSHWEA